MNYPVSFARLTIYSLIILLSLILPLKCYGIAEEPLIKSGGYMVISASGKTLGAFNETTSFIPASIFKIITALQGLDSLGPDYRFPTYFFITPGVDLYIVGTGDPLLISEDIDGIVQALKKRGLKHVRNIFIDNSNYNLGISTINETISQNPYDTALSAVGVNFNTIKIKVTDDLEIISGEEQTPTLPIMGEKGQGLPPGVHRINLGSNSEDLALYAGQLFEAGFSKGGIGVTGQIASRKTPSQAGLFYCHYSAELKEMIPAMLLYSNNYMANQIYLQNGVKMYGYPATWEKAQRSMIHFLKSNNLELPQQIVDGAGLSKGNRISCQTMIGVLQKFRLYAKFLPLKQDIPLKSGTMNGVYSYAGFFGTEADSPAFVIILNQEENRRDEVLMQLIDLYGAASEGNQQD